MARILATGAAFWIGSGYGKPWRYLFPIFAEAGHELALATFYGYMGRTTVTEVDGAEVRLYPIAREKFFNDIIEYHAGSFSADVVISLQDVWTLEGWGERDFVWCPWFPVDTDPVSQPVLAAIEGCHTPISFSQFGQRQLVERGWEKALYIPLGADMEVHQPRPQEMAREKFNLPEGFIAGMIAANASLPSRKSFPEVLMAWKRWLDGGGEGLLYLHTTLSPRREHGVDFPLLLEIVGLDWSTLDDPDEERRAQAQVMFPTQHRMWCGAYDDEAVARLYNSFNVLLSPSMSEGFGIPIIEAQASGVPVITLNTTSMAEITFSGVCLEPIQRYWEGQGGWRGIVGVGDLAEAINWAWQMSRGEKARQYLREKARENVKAFSWERIAADYWLPFLEGLEGGL